MTMYKATATKRVANNRTLTLLSSLGNAKSNRSSLIPEIRTGLRQQVKTLNSVSLAVLILGAWAEFMLILTLESLRDSFGEFACIIVGAIGIVIAITALVLMMIIRFCASEINEQTKKLNKEV